MSAGEPHVSQHLFKSSHTHIITSLHVHHEQKQLKSDHSKIISTSISVKNTHISGLCSVTVKTSHPAGQTSCLCSSWQTVTPHPLSMNRRNISTRVLKDYSAYIHRSLYFHCQTLTIKWVLATNQLTQNVLAKFSTVLNRTFIQKYLVFNNVLKTFACNNVISTRLWKFHPKTIY